MLHTAISDYQWKYVSSISMLIVIYIINLVFELASQKLLWWNISYFFNF